MADNNWELELNEYIRQGEPGKVDKSNAWKTAIGLQDVDGIKTSKYLLETAKEHIEGKLQYPKRTSVFVAIMKNVETGLK